MLRRDLKFAEIEEVSDDGVVLDVYSLRYTTAMLLFRAGIHPRMAQRIMRHSSINLTMNLYTQMRVADEDASRDADYMFPTASSQAESTDLCPPFLNCEIRAANRLNERLV